MSGGIRTMTNLIISIDKELYFTYDALRETGSGSPQSPIKATRA